MGSGLATDSEICAIRRFRSLLRHFEPANGLDLSLSIPLAATGCMSKLITILNGPNLNLLGQRQPEIYGSDSLADVERNCAALAKTLGLSIRFLQSNYEGQLVDWIQESRGTSAGIIINPAAYTHTSVAILDALHTFDGPVLEVHISNPHQRESFRHQSYVTQRADALIAGCGVEGYTLALQRMGTLVGS